MSISFIQIVSISMLMLSGCSTYPAGVERTLREAGPNRAELENLLDRYKAVGDEEKYRAACFLVENMLGRYALSGPSLDRYYEELARFYGRQERDYFDLKEFQDSLFASETYFSDLDQVPDALTVDSQYLEERIEAAFEVRESRWAAELDFEEFCEYVLPYRIGTEELEPWWQYYREQFSHDLDSLSHGAGSLSESMKQFSLTVNLLFHGLHTYNGYPKGKPTLKPSSLSNMLGGTCEDSQVVYMALARTFGMPVARDFTPQWGNHSKGHSWVAMVHNDSTYHCALDEMARPAREKEFAYRLTKAYRWIESPYGDGAVDGHPRAGEVPDWLNNPRLKDVTGVYVDVIDLPMRVRKEGRSRYVLLCAFDDKVWRPLCASRRKGGLVTFRDVGFPVVVLPQYFRDGELSVAGWPVLVDSTGRGWELIPDMNSLETVHLKRKFMDRNPRKFAAMMNGGAFEFSNSVSFADAYRIAVPDTVGMNFQTVMLERGRRFRYFRYLPPAGGTGDIAEFEFYDASGEPIRAGKVIGTYIPKEKNTQMANVFDGATLTYAAHLKGQESPAPWVGIDFGRAEEITKMCYLPRTDDNFIREGEEYELCYWDGDGWSSLGRQIGSRATQELVYNNVPANALLLLHNHSKGKEERIFTYENGIQVWW